MAPQISSRIDEEKSIVWVIRHKPTKFAFSLPLNFKSSAPLTGSTFNSTFSNNPLSTIKEITVTSADENFLQKATTYVEENLNDTDLDGARLIGELGISRTMLYEKLNKLTGQTVNEFIRTIRLKYAAQYLLKSDMRINEISHTVGFNDAQYFGKSFKKQFGMTPREFKNNNGKLTE